MMLRYLTLAVAIAGYSIAFGTKAAEQTFFKSVQPDGRVVYGDSPTAGAKHSEKITVRTDTLNSEAEAEAAKRALQMSRQQLLRDSAARSARLTQLESRIAATYSELQSAQAERDSGREMQEGDRQGRRQSAQYWERQRRLDAAVRQIRQDLDRLLAERNALR